VAEPVDAGDFVYAHGEIHLPDGEPGQLSVVAEHKDRQRAHIVIRNMTPQTKYHLKVSAIARSPDGEMLGAGNTFRTYPATVHPGEIAWGYIQFGFDVEKSATLEYSLSGQESLHRMQELEKGLEITEHKQVITKSYRNKASLVGM